MRKSIMLAVAGLALLVGCGNQAEKAANIPAKPKWQGAPYHISFDKPPAKPNPSGVNIPVIKFTANPEELENRATLVVRFDSSKSKKDEPMMNQMIMGAVDIHGAEGALPADYMDTANKELSKFLGAYCLKGKIKLNVAIARSSLSSRARDAEIDSKRLSDWLPIEIDFKNPHPKC